MVTNTTSAGFHRILVPLDGSELAERALPAAHALARGIGCSLLLVEVVPLSPYPFILPGGGPVGDRYQAVADAEEHAVQRYLRDMAQGQWGEDVPIQTLTLHGDPAASLIDAAVQAPGTLVVMATHGRTGMARFALGSVADRVARFGRTPVLMVRPFGDASQAGHLERALVPLDGSTVSSQALNIVLQLAGTVIRQARLVSVVDPDQPSGATNDAQRMLGEAQALLLLDLEGRECAVDTAILYGKVADQIVERSRQDCDVVIMGTHGLVGIDRWAYGSMADRVLHGIDVPLLLVNASGDI